MRVRLDDLPGVCVKNSLMKGMLHVDNMPAPSSWKAVQLWLWQWL